MEEDREMQDHYQEVVNRQILTRARAFTAVGMGLYLLFNYVDSQVYPDFQIYFLKIRISIILILGLFLALTYIKKLSGHAIWFAQASITVMAMGIIFMIYKSNGASSHYYEGINLTFWGLVCMNGFYTRYNVLTGGFIIGLYAAAVLARPEVWNFPVFLGALCFMGATLILASLMTKFYSVQHKNSFIANENLARSQSELAESNQKLAFLYRQADQLSKIDDLTKIYNRRHFISLLERKIENTKKMGAFFYLTIFDIDQFKRINDTFGHLVGDEVIKQTAGAVNHALRPGSFLGRYGGDEFIFVIDQADKPHFLARIETVAQAIKNLRIAAGGQEVRVAASFGSVKVDSERFTDINQIIDSADRALLNVKQNNRGGNLLVE